MQLLDSIPARLQSVSNHCQVFGAARTQEEEPPKSSAALRRTRFCASAQPGPRAAEQTQAQHLMPPSAVCSPEGTQRSGSARQCCADVRGVCAFSAPRPRRFLDFLSSTQRRRAQRRAKRGSSLPLWGKAGVHLRPRFPSDMPLLREPRCKPLRPRSQLLVLRPTGAHRLGRGEAVFRRERARFQSRKRREELRCGRMFGGVAPLLLWRSSACAPTQINGCVYTEQGGGSGNGAGDKEGHAWIWREGGRGGPPPPLLQK